ncbi:hypothetical protein EVJ58_g10385 [Rhodofomes roseus]|uniref:Uncharacterized protein n=1 Tax=Rhodofomes roseus TaxID=34475 RepID=A0A4Y9XRH0_9APHY|nr:hypothetical protein EVJ58_g10385 [Rhodofomes roseus]
MDIDDTSNNNGNMGNRDSAANATDKDMDMDKDVGTSDQDDTSNEESSVDPVDAPVAILMQTSGNCAISDGMCV